MIVVGVGLFAILAFALTTELFAKNSPSVLYSQAVDLIRASDAVSLYTFCALVGADGSSTRTFYRHSRSPIRPNPPHRCAARPHWHIGSSVTPSQDETTCSLRSTCTDGAKTSRNP